MPTALIEKLNTLSAKTRLSKTEFTKLCRLRRIAKSTGVL